MSSKILELNLSERYLEKIITNLISLRDLDHHSLSYVTERTEAETNLIKENILDLEKQIAILDRSKFAIGDKVFNMDLVGTLLDIYLEAEPCISENRELLYKIEWDKDCEPKFAGTTNTYYIYNLIRLNPAIKYHQIFNCAYVRKEIDITMQPLIC